MPPSNDKELMRKAEAAQAIADDDGMALVPDDDGQPKPKTKFKDTAQAFDAGVNAGYSQALNDMASMLDRQRNLHTAIRAGRRVNL